MMVRTTKQIMEEYDDYLNGEVFSPPEERTNCNRLEKQEWVCLVDLQKEITALLDDGWTNKDCECRSCLNLKKLLFLCKSPEQNELRMTGSVFGEHNTGEDSKGSRTLIACTESSPVQNPQKKCTCPEGFLFVEGRLQKTCGRCGGH